jgi:hypothetical protein
LTGSHFFAGSFGYGFFGGRMPQAFDCGGGRRFCSPCVPAHT